MFRAETLEMALAPRLVRFYEQVASTNTLALEWLREGAATGAIVVAEEQTEGRGRLGRSWYAPPGTAIMVSLILRPPPEGVGRITMLGAVAVCELLERLGAETVEIKWPNDVRVDERKVCGILPEAVWSGDKLLGVVLGIGLNVRIDFNGTPFENTAISAQTALKRPLDRLALLTVLLMRIDLWSENLLSDELYDAWKGRMRMLGTQVTVNVPERVLTGIAEDVDTQGALLLRLDDGELRRVIAGDIALGE